MAAADPHRAIDAIWRIESAKVIASLARIVGDVGFAEDLAQDALVAALERWPEAGVPDNPGAWLMATAKNRAIDQLRRAARVEKKHEELGREVEARQEAAVADFEAAIQDDVGYSATAGEDWMRPQLCEEALRLGRILAELTSREPEVHGLAAERTLLLERSAALRADPHRGG